MMLTTPLTKLLNINTPIVSAPMAGVSGGLLAAKVSQAGGFGFLSSGYKSPEKFRQELSIARSTLDIPSRSTTLPIGIGFLGWTLETEQSQEIDSLDFALENRPQAIWFAFGQDLGRWIKYVRESDQKYSHKTLIFAQINTVSEALTAVNNWKVDVLVAQGNEAGGHGSASAPPLYTLVPAILSALGDKCPPLVAAGGLAVGRQVASILTLGASGVVIGTRFALSKESLYSDVHKKALIAADLSSTVRTMALDYAQDSTGWPKGVDGRGLRNDLVNTYDRGDGVEAVKKKLQLGREAQDPERMVIWAGAGVGLMNEIKRVEDIVKDLHRDTLEALAVAHGFVHSDEGSL